MSEKPKNSKSKSFEDAFSELQSILRELNDSKVPLDKLIEKYKLAKDCLNICRARLGEAELEVKKLGKNGLENFQD